MVVLTAERNLRNVGFHFLLYSGKKVLDYALELAREVVEKPRVSLITLKEHLVAPIREKLPGIIEQEIAMHEKTFHQAEVKDRINALFGR